MDTCTTHASRVRQQLLNLIDIPLNFGIGFCFNLFVIGVVYKLSSKDFGKGLVFFFFFKLWDIEC